MQFGSPKQNAKNVDCCRKCLLCVPAFTHGAGTDDFPIPVVKKMTNKFHKTRAVKNVKILLDITKTKLEKISLDGRIKHGFWPI